jgi:hypothetical protein
MHPVKSTHRWLPEVQVGMVLGTVQPLSVPCSIAMNFEPWVVLLPWTRVVVHSGGLHPGDGRDSAAVIESSDLDYTVLHPGWFTQEHEVRYELTHKGEPFVGILA